MVIGPVGLSLRLNMEVSGWIETEVTGETLRPEGEDYFSITDDV